VHAFDFLLVRICMGDKFIRSERRGYGYRPLRFPALQRFDVPRSQPHPFRPLPKLPRPPFTRNLEGDAKTDPYLRTTLGADPSAAVHTRRCLQFQPGAILCKPEE